MGFRIIKGQLIKKQRGNRSLEEIEAAAGKRFTRAALNQWENDGYKPKDENVPALLLALGCTYEDITEPVELVSV